MCAYEFDIPAQHEVRGSDRTQRAFVLLDEHIQLQQPLTFLGQFEEWWYVDLVEVTEVEDHITIVDHWLDVAVPPDGQPYRVMDGHEFGDALRAGAISMEQAADGLLRFQHFLDQYLHGPLAERNFDATSRSWYNFPPASLAPVWSAPIEK